MKILFWLHCYTEFIVERELLYVTVCMPEINI